MISQPDVIAQLYRHSLPRLGAYAFLLTGSHGEAEELVQAAIVKVCARPRRLTNLPQAEAYVRAAIRTIHIDGLRKQARWHRAAPSLPRPDAVAGPADEVAEADAVATALGALVEHITGGWLAGGDFQPMNINYGLLPPMEAPRRDVGGYEHLQFAAIYGLPVRAEDPQAGQRADSRSSLLGASVEPV